MKVWFIIFLMHQQFNAINRLFTTTPLYNSYEKFSGVMSHNIWGGAQSLRGSVATERGEGVGVGFPPSHGRELFHFRLENVQSGAYLRRKFRLDDMYYMGKRVTIRPTGKRIFFFFTNSETWLWKYAPQNNLRKISNTCQRYTKYYITYNILIWTRYPDPDVETRERNERAWRGCDAVGCHSHGKGAFAILSVCNSVNEHHVGLQTTF